MANNFQKTGDWYVSQDGDDLNAGNTPDAPFATLGAALNASGSGSETIVVGAGTYQESVAFSKNSLDIIGDGAPGSVIFYGDGFNTFSINQGNNFDNLTFENYDEVFAGSGVETFENCIFKCDVRCGPSRQVFTDCVFDSAALSNPAVSVDFASCQFFNSQLNIASSDTNSDINRCYFDANSSVSLNTASFIEEDNNFHCGQIVISGTTYRIDRQKDGSAVTPTPVGDPITDILPNFYTDGNFNQDSRHWDAVSGNYQSVRQDSPNLRATVSLETIGAVEKADYYTSTGNVLNHNATQTDVVLNPDGEWIYNSNAGTGFGTILTAPIQTTAAGVILEASTIYFTSNYLSDISTAVGTPLNRNPLAVTDYAAGTAGANPQRFTVEMRYSTRQSQPVNNSQWDNDGIYTAGTFKPFEINKVPTIDSAGRSNGEPDFDPTTAAPIRWSFVQFLIYIREGITA